MQAHSQSSPAARNVSIFPSATDSQSTTPTAHSAAHSAPYLVPNAESTAAAAPTSAPTSAAALFPDSSLPMAEGLGLAHDAGNLLGALSLYCDLLEAPGVLPAEHRHYASELRLIYQRSGALIQRLLQETAQPSAAKSARQLAPGVHAAPGDVLRGMTATLARIAAPAAHVTVEVAPNIPHVNLPAEAVERIAVNLVRNAAEAIQSSHLSAGRIRVWMGVVCGRLRLSVEDNGPGMPPTLAAAFLRPAPLPPGAARGYGHRNVHELAAATGGRLVVHVRPGRGTTLCLDWPIPSTQLHSPAERPGRYARLGSSSPIAAMRAPSSAVADLPRRQPYPRQGDLSA